MTDNNVVSLREKVSKGSDVKYIIDDVIESNYSNLQNISNSTISDFFYPLIIKMFYVKRHDKNTQALEYITNLVSNKMVNSKSIPHTRREFTMYAIDGANQKLFSWKIGDLSLFNSGILFIYHKTTRKPIGESYYRSVGQNSYDQASKETRNDTLKNIFSDLSHNFLYYEDGLRELAMDHIWGGPGEAIVNQLIDVNTNKASSTSNKEFIEDRYYSSLANKRKYERLIR